MSNIYLWSSTLEKQNLAMRNIFTITYSSKNTICQSFVKKALKEAGIKDLQMLSTVMHWIVFSQKSYTETLILEDRDFES